MVELLYVMVIVGILVAVAAPALDVNRFRMNAAVIQVATEDYVLVPEFRIRSLDLGQDVAAFIVSFLLAVLLDSIISLELYPGPDDLRLSLLVADVLFHSSEPALESLH